MHRLLLLCCGIAAAVLSIVDADYRYIEKYYDQKFDHFNFLSHGNGTFKQRYLYNDTWWTKRQGPIFFYAGNEANIMEFWNNCGFLFSAAKQMNALVLFMEHRYYGTSLPFGNDSFSLENIGLLSIQQAMADYAFFLKDFKTEFYANNCPVIVFGGSYGGLLAAYMRFKYPNVVQGAIAASAPIYDMAGIVSGNLFFQAVTKKFRDISPNCEARVRSAYSQIKKWAALGKPGLKTISSVFKLCTALVTDDDYDHFLRWSRDAFVQVAMMNYPYPSNFLKKFPAFPVKGMCDLLLSSGRPVEGLFAAVGLYFNASQSLECFDIYDEYKNCADPRGCFSGFDTKAWDYQSCTEVDTEASTDGVEDMFPALPFDAAMRDEHCLKNWNVVPRREYLPVLFWGKDISQASNIVFSNGNLDPCTPGGVLTNVSDSVVSILIEGGAHHLDLRGDNPNDPPSVRIAREFEMQSIAKWIQEFHSSNV